ncbi:MAG: hypothetical protein EOL95_01435 [Bacteroidia bacterium]|nr:hypothetical protein [Bacteroidia bacterium]
MTAILNKAGLAHYDTKIKEYIGIHGGGSTTKDMFKIAVDSNSNSVPMRIDISALHLFGENNLDSSYGQQIEVLRDPNGGDYLFYLDMDIFMSAANASKINSLIIESAHDAIFNNGRKDSFTSYSGLLSDKQKSILVTKDYTTCKRLFSSIVGYNVYQSSEHELNLNNEVIERLGRTYADMSDSSLCGYLMTGRTKGYGGNYAYTDAFTGVQNAYLRSVFIAEDSQHIIFRFSPCGSGNLFYYLGQHYTNTKTTPLLTLYLNPADFEEPTQ